MVSIVRISLAALIVSAAAPAWAQDRNLWSYAQDAQEVAREESQRLLQMGAQEPIITIEETTPVSIDQILSKFRAQADINIDLDPANIPPEETRKFVAKGPFSAVFELFLRSADLYIVEETPRYIRLARPHRVTYSFSGANIQSTIEILAKDAGASIIIANDVTGSVSLTVNNVPWYEVLENIVKTVGDYVVVKERYNVLRVIRREKLNDQRETRVFQLRFLHPADFYTAGNPASPQVRGATPAPPATVAAQINEFPILNIIRAAMTTTSAGRLVGQLQYDPDRNAIVVNDTKPVLDKVSELIQRLDYEPEQVIVQARFISTRNTDLFHWGVTWSSPAASVGAQPSFGAVSNMLRPDTLVQPFLVNAFANPPVVNPGTSEAARSITRLPFGLGHGSSTGRWLNSYDVSLILRMYREDRYSRFLQEPTLAAVDGQPATIFVGREIRYAEEQQSTTGTGANTQPTVTLTEAARSPVNEGFTLFIIPKIIRGEDKIIMTVIPQFDRLSGTSSTVNPGFNTFTTQAGAVTRSLDLPELTRSTLVTRLVLQSGTSVILGGLNQFTDTRVDQKIPFLGDIPVLGWLFKGTQQTQVADHLMIVLTPYVVRPTQRASDDLREAFAGLALEDRADYEHTRAATPVEEWRRQQDEMLRKQREEWEKMKNPNGKAPEEKTP